MSMDRMFDPRSAPHFCIENFQYEEALYGNNVFHYVSLRRFPYTLMHAKIYENLFSHHIRTLMNVAGQKLALKKTECCSEDKFLSESPVSDVHHQQ
jgi:hypothetical protein